MLDLTTLRNPALYHGQGKKPPFFEGWYFKLVNAAETRPVAIIPGIFIASEPGASHAFIQTLDGHSGRSSYHRYPAAEFQAARGRFDIRIGPNRFHAGGVLLDIARPEGQMRGELRFDRLTPWPVTWASPGIMGWYAYVPFMECYHGVLSFDHGISGQLTMDGAPLAFDGGRGYLEKDWGQAFPRAWIWMQSNHFGAGAVGASLTASVAIIPWLRGAFPGFIVGLRHNGHLYRFSTYSGALTERLDLADTHVAWRLRGRTGPDKAHYRLVVDAWRAEGGLLHAPERVAMQQRVLESLTARLDVRLLRLDGGREVTIFEGVGRHAGLEIVGPIVEIRRLARLEGR